jgi:hypothetical protein
MANRLIYCHDCKATKWIDENYEGPVKCANCGRNGYIARDRPPQVIYVQQPQSAMAGIIKIAMGIILAIVALAFL